MIRLRQGESDFAKENHDLGAYVIEGIPPKKKGAEKIKVCLRVNENGILTVTTTAMHDNSESQKVIEAKRVGGLTEAMVAEMIERNSVLRKGISAGDV